MRAGPLSLPNITTAILPSEPNATSTGNASASSMREQREAELLCETYLENAAEVIRVLPAKKVVRAMIPLLNANAGLGEHRREEWGVVV